MGEVQQVFIEDMEVGQSASVSKTVTAEDIEKFAEVSMDNNPVHLDQAYAETTPFKARIAHGMLSAGFISAVLGTKLPGKGTIYMGQTLRFKAPVKIGDTVDTTCTVKEIIPEKKRVILDTVCSVAGAAVLEGEATVMAPSRG